jgi:hypothetical protein
MADIDVFLAHPSTMGVEVRNLPLLDCWGVVGWVDVPEAFFAVGSREAGPDKGAAVVHSGAVSPCWLVYDHSDATIAAPVL